MREGRHFPTSHAKQHTLRELTDRYISDILPRKPRSMLAQKAQLEWWCDELGDRPLRNVTTDVIAAARDKLLKRNIYKDTTLSPSSANRYVAALGHAFTIAIKEWRWIEISPITALKQLPEPRGRVRYLDEAE